MRVSPLIHRSLTHRRVGVQDVAQLLKEYFSIGLEKCLVNISHPLSLKVSQFSGSWLDPVSNKNYFILGKDDKELWMGLCGCIIPYHERALTTFDSIIGKHRKKIRVS